ncbi:antitoxin Xre/MbcA/ParS toxin-binding domain-containing protein [Fimbriimonas ginsengisoli]|uniref:Uncharacterized protein n=1 Tax=Fimbriimonas ginsengisoli Gsoil 348 TaxID=661478 RepID=A0A068NUW9_FIMGI|nr:antitoxin Xre/MbcA/ParS toxin-binding domain-containing protein [Fimbriimonas ginsengisoli]AIE87147.1 hypothetical protein OP10G_3779 [Fimbriimonas ginsengisoli Gsoil 348]
MINASGIATVLFGDDFESRSVRTLDDLRSRISKGLPKRVLKNTVSHVADRSGQQDLIYQIVPRGTLSRRDTLTPEESERVERLARVIATAEHVLGDELQTRRFMTSAHPLLGGKTPLELSYSELGARQVEELLWRIFYGVTE